MFERSRGAVRRWRATRGPVWAPRPPAPRVAQARRAVQLHRQVGGLALARSLAVLARVLGYASHHEEAVAKAREALALGSDDDWVTGWAHLAEADAQYGLDRFDDGHAAATSAAASFQRMRAHVEHGYARYAAALCLTGSERHHEAVTALEEARALLRRRPIRTARRSAQRALQCDSLLVQEYRLVGRLDDSLKVGAEAREFVDLLARMVPRQGRPLRATLLSRLGACREQLGDAAAAVVDYQTAIADLRLVPDSEALLGWCLSQLAPLLAALGRSSESDSAFAEALTIQDRLLPNDGGWLRTFASYTDHLWSAGERPAAATIIADRLGQLHRLASAAESAQPPPDLALLLRVSARRLYAVRRSPEAVRLAEAAVTVARRATGSAVAASASSHDLALALKDLGVILAGAGQLDDALDSWDDAADLLKALAVDGIETSERDLFDVVVLATNQLFLADRDADAIASADEAIAIARRLRAADLLAMALHLKAFASSRLHDHDVAIDAFDECIRLRQARLEESSADDRRDLVRCMRGRAFDLATTRRKEEARVALDHALPLARRCRDEEPEAGVRVLADVLRLAARVAAETGRIDDAVALLSELVSTLRDHPSEEGSRIEAAAFAWALAEAPDRLPQAWLAATGEPYPNSADEERTP